MFTYCTNGRVLYRTSGTKNLKKLCCDNPNIRSVRLHNDRSMENKQWEWVNYRDKGSICLFVWLLVSVHCSFSQLLTTKAKYLVDLIFFCLRRRTAPIVISVLMLCERDSAFLTLFYPFKGNTKWRNWKTGDTKHVD